ncbi:riboflavin synthase [Capnocytophaga canimorsus]|uniref:riboflavin synthase n=1 Tax=Capnocytophaga canimorsus TaxID=28188 RepID=UPI0037CD79B8
MFTGIVEDFGEIVKIEKENSNLHLFVKSNFTDELKIDQSVAHNGVCLTVVSIDNEVYKVTAIDETLRKTNLSTLSVGNQVNLERGMLMNARLDGHIVQGHVDQTAICSEIKDENGSTRFTFVYDPTQGNVTIEKGSITVNGVSLTVVDSQTNSFSVAIIPYTLQHTNFKNLKKGDVVNLEFDVIGKYVAKLYQSSIK